MRRPQHTARTNVVRLTGGRDQFDRYHVPAAHFCPACYQPVAPTIRHRLIEPHLDSVGLGRCPGSDEPYRIALAAPIRSLIA